MGLEVREVVPIETRARTVPDAILDQYYCYRGQRRQMSSKDRPEDRSEELVRRAFFQLRHLVHSALLFLSFPTRNRKAIVAQLFLVSGSQNQVGSSISMARTKKGLLRLKRGVTSDFRCLMGHVVQRGSNMGIASHC